MFNQIKSFFKKSNIDRQDKGNVSLRKSVPYKSYDAFRNTPNKEYICNAPFNNLYFNVHGQATVCWLTFDDPEVWSESNSVKDIWNSDKLKKLRTHVEQCDLDYRCKTCKSNIEKKRYVSTLANAYDNEYPILDYPTMMEFELSNTCNLECVMCTGNLSSSIRKNREHLPKLQMPYTAKFVEELKEFIPYLKEARFNGGEPFLINIYYDIWDEIIELNPSCKIVIATNGTVFNNRVKDYLAKGNFHINFSLDSLNKVRYEQIRVNANFDRVLENFKLFHQYCREYNRNLCVMVCAMRNNWMEIPRFLEFSNNYNVNIWLNTIYRPVHKSIWNLPSQAIEEIFNELSEIKIKTGEKKYRYIHERNNEVINNFINRQLLTWLEKAKEKENRIQEDIYKDKFKSNKEKFHNAIYNYVFKDVSMDIKGKMGKSDKLINKIESIYSFFKSDNMSEGYYYNLLINTDFSEIVYLIDNDDDSFRLWILNREIHNN